MGVTLTSANTSSPLLQVWRLPSPAYQNDAPSFQDSSTTTVAREPFSSSGVSIYSAATMTSDPAPHLELGRAFRAAMAASVAFFIM